MQKSKLSTNRLGRGIGALITGGIAASASSKSKAPVKKAQPVVKSTPKKPVPAKKVAQKVTPKPAVKQPLTKPQPKPKAAPVISTVTPASHSNVPAQHPHYRELAVDLIDPNPHQPRRDMDVSKIEELAESIRSEGLLQPIVVRSHGARFQLIAGERRLRACKHVGLRNIAARVVEVSDTSSAVIALVENLQREGLNPIEEALGYASLLRDFDLTQESVSERVGKSRSAVANALRLLQLDRELQGYLAKNLISPGHAKVLLGIEDSAQRLILARRIIENNLSVRETEEAVRRLKSQSASSSFSRSTAAPAQDVAIQDLERQLARQLSTKVYLKHTPKRGRLVIEYYGNEDLQRILEKTGLSRLDSF